MNLYSLLILTKTTKKFLKNVRPRKRVNFHVVYCHVNKTSQQYTALYTSYSHVLDDEIKAIAANRPLIGVRTWGDTPETLIVCPTLGRRHQHVAQCCRNTQPSLASVYVYKKSVWVLNRFIEMLIDRYLPMNSADKVLREIAMCTIS